MTTFKIGLYEEVRKITVTHRETTLMVDSLMKYYHKRNPNNWAAMYEELYISLRASGWGPDDCDGLARYWLKMIDEQD